VGTKDEVQMRREIWKLYVDMKNVSNVKKDYISGSYSEGFIFQWSDLDVMITRSDINVVVQRKGFPNTKCVYVAADADCQPGFCKLIPYQHSCSMYVDDDLCLSRIKYLNDRVKNLINRNTDTRSNGPCITTDHPIGFDLCLSFPIDPISSNKFLRCFPTNFWNKVKSKIVQNNVIVMHVVPKGPYEGDTKGIQWQKSSAILENNIICSLNHVQFCCFGLLKVLIHFKIEICDDTRDTLCSYHLKTVLFHVLEDIHSDFWIPSNIFHCLWICLTRLLLFVNKGVCPNYFLHQCNLFRKKAFLEKKSKIRDKLMRILQSGASGVLCDMKLLSIQNPICLVPSAPPNLRKLVALASVLHNVKGHQTTYHECMLSIFKVMVCLANERSNIKRAVLNYLFFLLMTRAGIILYDKYILYGFPEYLLSTEAAFILVRHSDASGSLYLATLWYCQGKFTHALNLLAGILRKLPDKSFLHERILFKKSLISVTSKSSCCFTDLMRRYYSRGMILHRESCFLPKVLESYVRKSLPSGFMMYDKSYTLFLMLLCYLEVHQKANCIKTFSKLQESYSDMRFDNLFHLAQNNSRILGEIAYNKMTELCYHH
jgi:hypothetical protein